MRAKLPVVHATGIVLLMFALTLPLFLRSSSGDSSAPSTTQAHPEGLNSGPDVIAGDLSSLQQFGSDGTQVGLAMGTDTCNAGNQELDFFAMPNTDHPVLAQNLYRMPANNDRLEQIGQSWGAHGFFALQSNGCSFGCTPASDGSHLGAGCSTADTASINAGPINLGSRAWLNPFTGLFPSTANNHAGHTHTGTSHRILVNGTDLDPTMNPGATYYAEVQLVTPHESAWCQTHPGECNMTNNASYRQFNVAGTTNFVFSPVGSTVRMAPAISAWPGATVQTIEPAPGIDGRAFFAYKVTGPVNGRYHYEYAIYNQNLDRAIQSFSVAVPTPLPFLIEPAGSSGTENLDRRIQPFSMPIGAGIMASNKGFHAPPQHPGFANDGTQGDAGYSNAPWTLDQAWTWSCETFAQNPNANAIRWGTLYNFRFDASNPPQGTTATIGFFKTGTPITVATQVPRPSGGTPTPTPSPSGTPIVTHFEVIAPPVVVMFSGFNFTVRALDQFNNTATNYTGTVHFTTTAKHSLLPPDDTLINGFRTFSADIESEGIQTITATDTANPSITGTSNNILVLSDQPTPPPTPTPPPCPGNTVFRENFDQLPAATPPFGPGFRISNETPDTQPNDVFCPDPPGIGVSSAALTFSNLTPVSPSAQITFRNNFDTEFAEDGGVMEVSSPNISAGDFLDITDSHVGGSFAAGGYNSVLSDTSGNPLGGRLAWSGNSGGYIDTIVNLGPNLVGQTITLRWRFGSAAGGSGVGWRIDTITSVGVCGPGLATPTPAPTPVCTPLPPSDQGFDDITTLVPAGWFMQNNSQPGPGTTGWFQGNSTVFPAQSGDGTSYIGANTNNGTGTSTLSNWLLTPPMTFGNGAGLIFWTRTVDTPMFPDRLQVRMSTNGASTNVGSSATDVGDFTTLLLDINPTYSLTGYPNVWTQYTVLVSGVPTPVSGRLAFRYFVENGGPAGTNSDYVGIDSVSIGPGCGGSFVTPTPTPTPPLGPTPTPTIAPSPSPPFEGGTLLWEGFDTSAPPALPSGWQTSFTPGAANCTPTGTCGFGTNWATSTSNPYSGPVAVFHDAPACVTDSVLDTPAFWVPFINTIDTLAVSFRQSFNLENGRDGAVLEISIGGGPFTDIVAAGGSVNYNGTIATGFQSPIAGRQAWTGNSGGYISSWAGLPKSALGLSVVLRFRLATDCSGSGTGWSVDEVFAYYHFNGTPFPSPSPTPTPPTPTPSPTPSPSPSPTASPTPTPTIAPSPSPPFEGDTLLWEGFDSAVPPALPSGWQTSFTPGAANCTPTGTCGLGTNWATTTTNPDSGPACVFHDAPACVTDSVLDTPTFFVPFINTIDTLAVLFRQSFNLENGRDGGVLEISTDGGPFTDIVAAGGSVDYTGTIATGFQSPIGGRQAWTGDSGGYIWTQASLPKTAIGRSVVLRFRLATDCSGSGTGWFIDEVWAYYHFNGTPFPSPPPTQPLNVSTRLNVQTGDNAGIGGFIVTGTASKHLLFRGIGPSLAGTGVPNALANPTLDLRDSNGVQILANDNWRDTQEAEINATGIPPTNNLEAAIVDTLDPGSYTVILGGMGMTSGVGLVEIYDLDQGANAKLANLSTRAFVSTGNDVVIAGFILGGSSNDRVIVRGIGPSLTATGVPNALLDPTLELRDSNGALRMSNNDWQDDQAQAALLAAAGLAPTNNLESGIAVTLSPGLYTAMLAGRDSGTGVGLVEIYDLGQSARP